MTFSDFLGLPGVQASAIARTEREIAMMQEYRTRLTADLVTGKLDVREAAAKLPEPPPNPPLRRRWKKSKTNPLPKSPP